MEKDTAKNPEVPKILVQTPKSSKEQRLKTLTLGTNRFIKKYTIKIKE